MRAQWVNKALKRLKQSISNRRRQEVLQQCIKRSQMKCILIDSQNNTKTKLQYWCNRFKASKVIIIYLVCLPCKTFPRTVYYLYANKKCKHRMPFGMAVDSKTLYDPLNPTVLPLNHIKKMFARLRSGTWRGTDVPRTNCHVCETFPQWHG